MFNILPPMEGMTPEMRQWLTNMALMQAGAGMLGNARQGMGPALAAGMQGGLGMLGQGAGIANAQRQAEMEKRRLGMEDRRLGMAREELNWKLGQQSNEWQRQEQEAAAREAFAKDLEAQGRVREAQYIRSGGSVSSMAPSLFPHHAMLQVPGVDAEGGPTTAWNAVDPYSKEVTEVISPRPMVGKLPWYYGNENPDARRAAGELPKAKAPSPPRHKTKEELKAEEAKQKREAARLRLEKYRSLMRLAP